MIRASVLVCTRNRSRSLAETLEAVLALSSPIPWELLVVDNASRDDTLAVARKFAERHPERVRVEIESVVGLSAARNCGVRHARGEWIAFLDDDALPSPSWLEAYERALGEPNVLSAGGPVEPIYSSALPPWFDARFLPYLSVWDLGAEPLDLRYNELPRGANVAYRREAFERVGEFDRRLGRSGRSLRSCEETELGLRLERAGFRTLYAPEARVRHRVDASRLTPDWLVRRFSAQGFSEAIVDWKHRGKDGLREGRERRRQGLKWLRNEVQPGSLRLRCEESASRGYRRGALYAVAAVARWNPDAPPPESWATGI